MENLNRLLLVEDSADDAELLILELERNGFQLHWERVQSARALKMALKSKPWDIVISDFFMPGFSAFEALKIVRQFDPLLPFILVSGKMGEEVAVKLMKEGAQDYVLKQNLTRLASTLIRELKEADIKRKAFEDANLLKESNERLKLIYNSTSEFMYLIRVEGEQLIIESVNQAFTAAYQRFITDPRKENFEEMSFSYFLNALVKLKLPQINQILDQYWKVIQSKSPARYIERFAITDQLVYLETLLNPIIKKGRCTHLLCVSRDVSETIHSANKLQETLDEVERLKHLLEQENSYLKEEIKLNHNFDNIIFSSQSIAQMLKQVEQVAPVDATVLILGETGTGKELIARSIHNLSSRKNKPLVKINCAALPKDLIESELFGHEKGAFTGATHKKVGHFELAQNGTIFLDEIGELPIDLQPKLLRILQEGELQRLGSPETIQLNVRIIAATNRDLREAISEGVFREDLFYRLNVFPINIPPLRERKEDINPLVSFFIQKYSRKFNKQINHIPASAIAILENYDWPGNIRELENMVERALILSLDGQLPFAQLLGVAEVEEDQISSSITSLKEIERKHILKVLQNCNWRINGAEGAAEQLELAPTTLRDKMKKLGISRPKH